MNISRLIWQHDIVEKLDVKHQVLPDEVEEVFANQPKIKRFQKGHFRGEDVYRALGQTDDGRYLVVFFILKLKLNGAALILSARDMDDKERKEYGKK